MPERLRVAVIPTHDRPREFIHCVAAIADQVDHLVVVDHGTTYAEEAVARYKRNYQIVSWEHEEPNISAMWNLGLNAAHNWAEATCECADPEYDVAVLNDDALPPFGWVELVTTGMRMYGATAGCTIGGDAGPILHTKAEPVPLPVRMAGHAFILAGETDLRADESLQWWFGDDDLDWRSRELGGTLVIPSTMWVPNKLADTTTVGALAEQARRDRDTFETKWGTTPW